MRRDVLLQSLMIPATMVLVVLLGLSLLRLGADHDPEFSSRPSTRTFPRHPAADQTRAVFSAPGQFRWIPLTNHQNPFFTLAIRPPPPDAPAPPPPATRKVDVTYRGFFQTSAGVRRAVLTVADRQILAGTGDPIVADYSAVEIDLRHLTATNAAGQTIRFDFARPVAVEIPAQ